MLAFFLPISKYLQGLHCFHNKQGMEFKQVEGQAQRCLWRGWKAVAGLAQAPLGPKPVGTGMTLPHLEVRGRGSSPSSPYTWG